MRIGYARVSTEGQDLAAQQEALRALGVPAERIYEDKGLTGANRARPGLQQALAAAREGDEFVVTKLDRLARSIRDAQDIATELHDKKVTLRIGSSAYDPTDPMGRMMFNVLALFAEFERDLIRMRTREGMSQAKAKGRLRGRKPKLSAAQERHLVELHQAGRHTSTELAELFGVARSTVYRAVARAGETDGRNHSGDRGESNTRTDREKQ